MKHTFTDPDLIELDRIWPIGQILEVPEGEGIVVAGAWHGRYIRYLNEMFPSSRIILGFEPQLKAWQLLGRSFDPGDSRIRIRRAGLGTANRSMVLSQSGTDGASVLGSGGPGKEEVVDIFDMVEALPLKVGLFVMNMEGSEWALIPYMLDEMMHHRIASLAIQFHPQYVSDRRAQTVVDYLSEYYENTYNAYPTWTYWKRRT